MFGPAPQHGGTQQGTCCFYKHSTGLRLGWFDMLLFQVPPVRFFWSLTMYDLKTRLLVDNPIDRYSIGDRTEGLKYGSDGSLKISVEPDTAPQSASWPLRIGKLIIALQNARVGRVSVGERRSLSQPTRQRHRLS